MEKPSPGCFPAEPHERRNVMFPNGFSGIHCHEESPSNISTLAFLLHVRSRTFKISAVCRYLWLPWVASSLHLVKARMSPPQETAPIIPSLSLIHHGTLESYLCLWASVFSSVRGGPHHRLLHWRFVGSKWFNKYNSLKEYLCILNSTIIIIVIVIIQTLASFPYSHSNTFTNFCVFKVLPWSLFIWWFPMNFNLTGKCHEITLPVFAWVHLSWLEWHLARSHHQTASEEWRNAHKKADRHSSPE